MNQDRPGTATSTTCPNCGATVAVDAVAGLCRKCLLRGLVSGLAESGDSHGSFGEYELLGEIARGGMGVVYRARLKSLNRVVALKVIQAGRLASAAEVKRFQIEAEAAARLEHPNIVPIYEVGEHDARPYFTMKLVEGGSLADRCSELRVSGFGWEDAPAYADRLTRNVKLVATVARAVHYAHQRGILHRDLKPANILIDAQGEPHVTDFGLAKQLESVGDLTLSGAVIGTPSYMAPEQAAGKSKEVTTAADVYSLGAILYELLAGRPPFQADTPLATMRMVLEEEPVPPSRFPISDSRLTSGATTGCVNRKSKIVSPVDRDLETICLKCLQKNPAHRYPSAEALAEDMERWLRQEPIKARPSTIHERAVKWTRRHPARTGLIVVSVVAALGFVTLLLISGERLQRERNDAVAQGQKATVAAARADAEAKRANEAKAQTRQNLYAADMMLAQHALDDGNLGLARRLVEAHRPAQNQEDLRGFEWRHLWKQCQGDQLHTLHGHSNGVHSVAFSRDGKLLASGDRAGAVKLWNVATRRPFDTLAAGRRPIVRVSFSADGQALATADESGLINVWDLATRAALWTHQGRNPRGVQLSPTGTWIGFTEGPEGSGIHVTNSAACVVDWVTGREVLRVAAQDFEGFAPEGERAYLTGARPSRAELWDLATGQRLQTFPGLEAWVFPSPNGRIVAGLPYWRTEITFIDLADHKPPALLRLNSGAALSLAFSPDSKLLAGAVTDQTVRIWDVSSQREVARFRGHVDAVTGVAFSPDGQVLATSSADHTVMFWPMDGQKNTEIISEAWPPYLLSPDGKTLAAFDKHVAAKKIVIWDTATHQATALTKPGEPLVPEFFSADSRTLVARAEPTPEGFLPLLSWDLNAPARPPRTMLLNVQDTNAVFGAASALEAPVYALRQVQNQAITLWNPLTGEALGQLRKQWLGKPWKLSPDGHKLVGFGSMFQFSLTDLATPNKPAFARLPVAAVRGMAFSPDGHILAIACSDHTIRLYDTGTCKEVAFLSGHQQGVEDVAFSPDGRTLASCSVGGVVKLWSWATRREVATLIRGTVDFGFVAFTRDNNTLLAADSSGRVHFFRAPALAEIDGPR